MPERTYIGFAPRGEVVLPDRRVPFTRGTPVDFTADEAALLGDDWVTTKKAAPAATSKKATTEESSDG